MSADAVLAAAEAFAREQLAGDATGHDWWHTERVRRLARAIAHGEGADAFTCELAALLHDVADDKIAGDEETGMRRVREWLAGQPIAGAVRDHVMEIIATLSFAGGNRPPMRTLEGAVVQDADRLDAIGAIGIARTFAYGGARGRPLHEPGEQARTYATKEEYRASTASSTAHFREKLLLLKDRMNTAHARRLAEARHQYMVAFLEEFQREWDGER
jgi:uncharacterized protein